MSIPTHYIKKRDLLHAERSTPAVLTATAREFMAAERYSDALDFFEKAKDLTGMNDIKQLALRTGDTFLLSRLDRYDRTLVSQDEWKATAALAVEQGRPSMAEFVAKKFPPPDAAAAKVVVLPGSTPLSEN